MTDEQKIKFLLLAKENLIQYINNEKLVNVIVFSCVDYLHYYSEFTLQNLEKFYDLVFRESSRIYCDIETLSVEQFEDAYHKKIQTEEDFQIFISLKI